MGKNILLLVIAIIFLCGIFEVIAVDYGGQWIVQDGDFCRGGVCGNNNLTVKPGFYAIADFYCLTGDSCISTWPVGGAGTSWADADYQQVVLVNETGVFDNSTSWIGTNGTHAWFNSWLLNLTIGELDTDTYNTSSEFFAVFNQALQNNMTSLNESLKTAINESYDQDYLVNISIDGRIRQNNMSAAIATNISATQFTMAANISSVNFCTSLDVTTNSSATAYCNAANLSQTTDYVARITAANTSLLTDINASYDEDYLGNISFWRAISLNNWSATISNNQSILADVNASYDEDYMTNFSIWRAISLNNWSAVLRNNMSAAIAANVSAKAYCVAANDSVVNWAGVKFGNANKTGDMVAATGFNGTAATNITTTKNVSFLTAGQMIKLPHSVAGEFWFLNKNNVMIEVPYYTSGDATPCVFGSETSITTGLCFNNAASKITIQRAGTVVINLSMSSTQTGWIEMTGNLTFQSRAHGIKASDADGAGYTCCVFNDGAITCRVC